MEHVWHRHGGGVEEPERARKVLKMAQPWSLHLTIALQRGDRYDIAEYQTCLEMFCNQASVVITKLKHLQRNYRGGTFQWPIPSQLLRI